jgi:uncharacterized protein (UPF0332 family)
LKLARHRLARAKEAFGEGGHLLTKGAPMGGAVNRFYYAAFYAARALLAVGVGLIKTQRCDFFIPETFC